MIIPNIPRIYTGIAEWAACVLYICQCPRRLRGPKLWGLLAGMLAVQCTFLELTGSVPLPLWMPCMAVAVGLMFLLMAWCCDMPLASAGYFTARAFLLAEFAASLAWQVFFFLVSPAQGRVHLPAAPVMLGIYASVFALMYALEHRQEPQSIMAIRTRELWPAVTIALCSFLMSNLSFVSGNTPFTGSEVNDIHIIRTLVDLAGVAMMYAYHVQRSQLYARQELDKIQDLLNSQYAQYRQSRESIELINRKYHDLKHQIAVLRAEEDSERRAAFLDEMENEIKNYEAQNKTGSSVLDTVLTSKSLYCAKHQIELTCVADGGSLDFMSAMDLSTIFGNMLDNAIECELKNQDKSERLIHVEVYTKKDFLIVRCENYCKQAVQFRDGLPVTTKADKSYHGYGIKSIQYTARKYGGSATVDLRDHWFVLSILIPLPEPGRAP